MRSVTDGIPICFIIYEGERRERERESQRAFIHSKLLGEEEEKSEEDDEERKKNSSSSSSSSSYDEDDDAI